MLKGIVFKGDILSIKAMDIDDILSDETCAVIVDDKNREIYLWVGKSASVQDKFKAARTAQMLNWKFFGGAARIVQDHAKIRTVLVKYARIDEDIPTAEIKMIIG